MSKQDAGAQTVPSQTAAIDAATTKAQLHKLAASSISTLRDISARNVRNVVAVRADIGHIAEREAVMAGAKGKDGTLTFADVAKALDLPIGGAGAWNGRSRSTVQRDWEAHQYVTAERITRYLASDDASDSGQAAIAWCAKDARGSRAEQTGETAARTRKAPPVRIVTSDDVRKGEAARISTAVETGQVAQPIVATTNLPIADVTAWSDDTLARVIHALQGEQQRRADAYAKGKGKGNAARTAPEQQAAQSSAEQQVTAAPVAAAPIDPAMLAAIAAAVSAQMAAAQ